MVGLRGIKDASLNLITPGITALVGKNDSGKTALLEAFRLLLHDEARPHDEDYCRQSPVKLIKIGAQIDIDERLAQIKGISPGQWWVIREFPTAKYYLARGFDDTTNHVEAKSRVGVGEVLPYLLIAAGSLFTVSTPHAEPKSKTDIALGELFRFKMAVPPHEQAEIADAVQDDLAALIQQVWSPSIPVRFRYIERQGVVTYSAYDQHGKLMRISRLGFGIQRALSMAIQIYQWSKTIAGSSERLIILDEPEISLHPGAQHNFRKYLSQLVKHRDQIVLATHAPGMIDISAPETIRIITRGADANVRVFDRFRSRDNFESVRTALGMIPADSLFVGQANVIVEGPIDHLVLLKWAQRLFDAGRSNLNPHDVHFINAGGDPLPHYFSISLSTGVPTYAIVDNDPAGIRYEERIRKKITTDSYSLDYEPIFKLFTHTKNSSLENAFPAARLVAAINEASNPLIPIDEAKLTADSKLSRMKNIERYLDSQNLKLDEHKTEIGLSLAENMDLDEIPRQIDLIFNGIAEDILTGKSATRA